MNTRDVLGNEQEGCGRRPDGERKLSNRRGPGGNKTISQREMMRQKGREKRFLRQEGFDPEQVEQERQEVLEIIQETRPKVRAQCVNGCRPCNFVACSQNLYLDVHPETGSIKINQPDREPWEMEESCALDLAERGGMTLEEVGDVLNMTRENVRLIEIAAMEKLRDRFHAVGIEFNGEAIEEVRRALAAK